MKNKPSPGDILAIRKGIGRERLYSFAEGSNGFVDLVGELPSDDNVIYLSSHKVRLNKLTAGVNFNVHLVILSNGNIRLISTAAFQ